MSDVIVAKVVSIAIIFAGSLICGLLPAFRVFAAFPRFALSLILSYGGGILIATSLVHILPEARESWPKQSSFTAEMSLCVGIFIVYFVEELAHFLVCHDLHSPLGHHGEGDGHNHGVHVHHEEPPNRCDEPAAVYLFAEEMSRSGEHGHHHHHPLGGHHCGSGGGHLSHLSGGRGGGEGGEQIQTKLFPITPQSEPKIVPGNGGGGAGGNNRKDGEKGMTAATLRSLLGLIALSIHAGLEGLSVGLGKDASDVWYLCGAVAAHKLVIAFCLGMEVRNASSSPCTLVTTSSSASFKCRYVLFFALMTPVGIAIGTIITEFVNDPGQAESTLVAVLQTLASGTLLYVAFFEVVLRERARFSGRGLAQLAAVILGFTTMALVEVYIGGHNHASGHDDCDHDHMHNFTDTTTLLPGVLSRNLTLEEKLID